jgi:dsRNA-specific ribonuclease
MELKARSKVLRGPQPILKSSSPNRSIVTPASTSLPIESVSTPVTKKIVTRMPLVTKTVETKTVPEVDVVQERTVPSRPTFSKSTTHKSSVDMMTSKKIVNMIQQLFKTNFSVIEGTSDLGNLSLAFIESPKVKKVVTFMSTLPIENYREKAEQGGKSDILEESFTYSPALDQPYILFFYPNILMENYKQMRNFPNLWSIIINDMMFDQIVENEIGGTKFGVGPSYIILLGPRVKIPTSQWKVKVEPVNQDLQLYIIESPNNAPTKNINAYKPASQIDPRDEKEWRENLRLFLINLLTPIYDEEITKDLLDEDVMDIWSNAFTHETFDLNNNYEQLETIGDRVLELPFVKYILNLYPSLTSQEITLIKSKYMSKLFQGTTARKLGFGPWIRIAEGLPSVSILEDTFESFFGALDAVAEKKIGPGFGFILTLKFLIYLFKDIYIDPSAGKNPKSQIKEIFEKLNWGKGGAKEETNFEDNIFISNILLTPDAKNDLVRRGIIKSSHSMVLGTGYGGSKTTATTNAYFNALQVLKEMGITYESAKEEKEVKDLVNAGITKENIDKINQILQQKGFDKFEFFMSKTTTSLGGYILQFIGSKVLRNESGEPIKTIRTILESKKVEDLQKGKVELLNEFLAKN